MAQVTDAISAANRIYRTYEHRRTERIAKEMGILIIPTPFKKQKGAYKVIDRQSIIFINDNLHPVVREIVFGHELGHHLLHREEAVSGSGFQEFNLFDMRENRMEYEAVFIILMYGGILPTIREQSVNIIFTFFQRKV